jgi:hypothetical protein
MKKCFLLVSFLISALALAAQPMMRLSATEHDFGTFKEEAGRQTYNFDVTNTGDSPLVLQNIVASCGCTTPTWTRNPIPPNGNGTITAIYDPANRPGPFNKTLSVYTNSKPQVTVIVLKGEVIQKEKTIEDIYTWPVGPVRFESNHLAFTTITKGDKKIRVMPIINTSDEPVKVEFEGMPAHLQLKTNPETLKPGQKGIVEGTYDASKNNGWGTLSDMVRVKINGTIQQNGYFYVSANLLEDFSSLSKEELENAPVFKVDATTVDIGKMDQSTTKDVIFNFKNDGKRDLIIRYIRPTCGCTAVQQGGQTSYKPGESGTIKATFNSGSYENKVTKAIYVYTNDPKHSENILMLTADVTPKN